MVSLVAAHQALDLLSQDVGSSGIYVCLNLQAYLHEQWLESTALLVYTRRLRQAMSVGSNR